MILMAHSGFHPNLSGQDQKIYFRVSMRGTFRSGQGCFAATKNSDIEGPRYRARASMIPGPLKIPGCC